ncbi:MAG: toll/interleukin-1 receptor domain-containing protein [Flavobacteriaceae bacterium]|nr:toll/interleukin-1 receptor domain-containing protein [Flavobacteriaceae bacterium]
MRIFISHSSRDRSIVESFIEKILVQGCKLSEESIFCTSIEGLDIRTGEDFRAHIKHQLLTSDHAFLMISQNYVKSEICLNEMGACWALDSLKVLPYLIDTSDYASLGILMGVKQAAKIENSAKLDELYEVLSQRHGTPGSLIRWNKHKEEFLSSLKTFHSNEVSTPYPDTSEYFKQYIMPNASINHLLLMAHPTLLDCKKIFKKEHYKKAFLNYCNTYEKLVLEHFEPLYPSYKNFEVSSFTVYDLLDRKKGTGGMIELAVAGYLNYDVVFYEVEFFQDKGSDNGLSYIYFSYVNNRWVFLWKPWRV